MLRIDFTDQQVERLAYERFHHPHPRVQRKMEAVYLKARGLSHQQICQLTGICGNTLRSYLAEFVAGSVEGLKRFEAGGTTSALKPHLDQLCEYFVEHPPHTVAEAVKAVEQLTGIRRSQTQVRQFLKRAGFSRRKVGSLPAQADLDEQQRFKKTSCCHA